VYSIQHYDRYDSSHTYIKQNKVTEGVTRKRKSNKDKQYNVRDKNGKWTNKNLQNTTHKTNDMMTKIRNKEIPHCMSSSKIQERGKIDTSST
jgi:hypothetical protein